MSSTAEAREYGDLAVASGLKFRAPITVTAVVDKIQEQALVHVEVTTVLAQECSRCIEPFESEVVGSNDALFLPRRVGDVDGSLGDRLQRESQRVQYYDGGLVDLSELIIEAISLAAPMKPLCRAECKGICPNCGASLNDNPCTCTPGPLTNQPFKDLL
jgi:DUF177 domain-containing protein